MWSPTRHSAQSAPFSPSYQWDVFCLPSGSPHPMSPLRRRLLPLQSCWQPSQSAPITTRPGCMRSRLGLSSERCRHARRYIFRPGSFGYCKLRFIPIYVFMFWNGNWVFKLTTVNVPSSLQTRNFQSSVIHHHEFSLMGKFNLYICENLFEKHNCT